MGSALRGMEILATGSIAERPMSVASMCRLTIGSGGNGCVAEEGHDIMPDGIDSAPLGPLGCPGLEGRCILPPSNLHLHIPGDPDAVARPDLPAESVREGQRLLSGRPRAEKPPHPKKRRRSRPKGSRNRVKPAASSTKVAAAPVDPTPAPPPPVIPWFPDNASWGTMVQVVDPPRRHVPPCSPKGSLFCMQQRCGCWCHAEGRR